MIDRKHLQEVFARLLRTRHFSRKSGTFLSRLGLFFPDLYTLFHDLYGERTDWEERFYELVSTLSQAFRNRPADLRTLDLYREENPKWYLSERLASLMLYVDRFAGTIKGIGERIPYFQELGVNLIHLMPLLRCPAAKSDGGYAVSDYRQTDQRLGTMADVQSLARLLHARNMLLQLDLVVNHTSDQHHWAQQAQRGNVLYQDYYYLFSDRSLPDRYEETLPEIFPETAPGNFTFLTELNKWVMTVFHDYQWDLNYTNPRVLIEMVDILLFLANQGADLLRLDAVPYLWKRLGTQSRNLPEAHTILRLMNACCRVVAPGTVLIAEAVVEPWEVIRYFGEGDYAGCECEMAYHVPLMVSLWDTLATRNARLLKTGLKNLGDIPSGSSWLTYIRCHDDIGLGYADQDIREAGFDPVAHRRFIVDFYTGRFPGSFASGEAFMVNPRTGDARISGSASSLAGLEKALREDCPHDIDRSVDRLVLLYGIVFSIGGIPIVYSGDEVGLTNDYSFRNDPHRQHDNRWLHRPAIDWETMNLRTVTGTVENRIFTRLQALLEIRRNTPEFSARTLPLIWDISNEQIFCFLRAEHQKKTLVLANLTDSPQRAPHLLISWASLPAPVIDRISGQPPLMAGESILLAPYQLLWLTGTGVDSAVTNRGDDTEIPDKQGKPVDLP